MKSSVGWEIVIDGYGQPWAWYTSRWQRFRRLLGLSWTSYPVPIGHDGKRRDLIPPP